MHPAFESTCDTFSPYCVYCCLQCNNRQGLAELTQGTLLQNASLAGLGDMAKEMGLEGTAEKQPETDAVVMLTVALTPTSAIVIFSH
jgi:hypothetical protein